MSNSRADLKASMKNDANKALGNETNQEPSKEHLTSNGIKYKISNEGIEVNGIVSPYLVDNLLPKVYKVEHDANNKMVFKCGPTVGQIYDALNMHSKAVLEQDLVNYQAAKDIISRQQNGEQITNMEKTFAEQSKNRLNQWGIVEQNGKLVQLNPRGFALSYSTVKDNKELEKQEQKDKKEAAKQAAARAKYQQNSR